MSISESLADSIQGSGAWLTRYLAGFDDSNATAQAAHLPNHVIWSLMHLAMTNHRGAEKIAEREMPLAYDPEPYAFDSTPVAQAEGYPTLVQAVEHYEASIKTLAAAIREAGDAALEQTIFWGGAKVPMKVRDLALRMVFHNGTHAGQIIDLRRALRLGRIIVMPPQPPSPPAAPRR